MLQHVCVDMQAIYLTITSERRLYLPFLRKTEAEEEAASTESMRGNNECGQQGGGEKRGKKKKKKDSYLELKGKLRGKGFWGHWLGQTYGGQHYF